MKRPFEPRLIALLLAAMMALSTPVNASSACVPGSPEKDATVGLVMQEEPQEPAPEEPAPEEPAPEEPAPEEPAPEEPAPEEPAPEEPAPEEPAPEEPAPEEPAPEEPAPEEPAPEEPAPEEPEPEEPAPRPVSEWTDEEIIEAYHIPDSWARAALIFAVRNGLMVGRGDEGLCPEGTATRAEMATMMVRFLACTAQADLSSFRDMDSTAWYYGFFSRAVALNLFAGTGSDTMEPNGLVTREQAFTVLAKAFGIACKGCGNIYKFRDWPNVSAWAAPKLSALIGAGLVAGYDGLISPKDNITRQELAQLFYRLLSGFGTELPDSFGSGCYVLSADGIPAGAVIDGDLMLINNVYQIHLDGVTVNGKLILQGASKVNVTMNNCRIRELVSCRSCALTVNGGVETVTALARTEIFDHVDRAEVYSMFIVHDDASVGTVNVNIDGAAVPMDGTADTVNVYGKDCKIGGKGSIGQLNVYGDGLSLWCDVGSKHEQIAPRLSNAVAVRTDSGAASAQSPRLTLGLRLTGLPAGPRGGSLTWYVNGKQVSYETRMLSEGMTSSVPVDFSAEIAAGKREAAVRFVLDSEGESFVYQGKVDLSDWIRDEAATIRTQAIQAELKYATLLYSDYDIYARTFSGALWTVPAGTVVTILKTSNNTGARVRLPDGTVGWLGYYSLSIYAGDYYTTSDYSREAKEYYVNTVRGYSSQTGYLIWISLYTQKVNVFQGSKGNWKLTYCFPCATGRNECPTPVESTTVLYRTPAWYYSNFYVHHVTVFDESRGFHSIRIAYDGSIYDGSVGRPASAGCVRMLENDSIWIYDNIPVDTAVEIY